VASLPRESSAPGLTAAPPPRLQDSRRWVKRTDRLARAVIIVGGIGIIIAVLLILILILAEAIPLWKRARAVGDGAMLFATSEANPVLLAFSDPYRETFVVLRANGFFQQVDRNTARVLNTVRAPAPRDGA